jgi:hypothetical protein
MERPAREYEEEIEALKEAMIQEFLACPLEGEKEDLKDSDKDG